MRHSKGSMRKRDYKHVEVGQVVGGDLVKLSLQPSEARTVVYALEYAATNFQNMDAFARAMSVVLWDVAGELRNRNTGAG